MNEKCGKFQTSVYNAVVQTLRRPHHRHTDWFNDNDPEMEALLASSRVAHQACLNNPISPRARPDVVGTT